MSNLLFLTFYYEPDLSAGSFRNTLLANILSKKVKSLDEKSEVIIVTTLPNRYTSYNAKAEAYEKIGNLVIHRIDIGQHKGGFISQAVTFYRYWKAVLKIQSQYEYDIIYASSSRLMTAFLGAWIKLKKGKKVKTLFLDIRDIFRESIMDVLDSRILRYILDFSLKIIEKFTFSRASIINVVTPSMIDYFQNFNREITCFSNGVDDVFFNYNFDKSMPKRPGKFRVTFAGNIGKAQALHKILPAFAQEYRDTIDIFIVGDGSSKQELIDNISSAKIDNIHIIPPMSRDEVLVYYKESDYLFLHLDDKKAFYKAIPSKLFEYAATKKPIIAGLRGTAKCFAKENIENSLIFDSNDTEDLIKQFKNFNPRFSARENFISQYRRVDILTAMSDKILINY